MKRTIVIFAALALCCASFAATAFTPKAEGGSAGAADVSEAMLPEASGRRVLKSVTVGQEGGRLLDCHDIMSAYTSPSMTRFVWNEAGEPVPFKPSAARRAWKRPTLPQSDTAFVTYGKVPSRNEFGINQGWFYSPDCLLLAVYRVDERAVSEFPLLDISTRTGSLKSIRYPMNGMPSEKVQLCVCDTSGHVLNTLAVSDFTPERYLAGVTWTPDCTGLIVSVIDRSQHEMRLNLYDASTGAFVKTILTEKDDAWVESRGGVHFVGDGGCFIYDTDTRDGCRQLYLCDLQGSVHRITGCQADVSFAQWDGSYLYYMSAEVSPAENHLFRISLKLPALKKKKGEASDFISLAAPGRISPATKARIGKPERLTTESGMHGISFSPDKSRFIDRWSAVDCPGQTLLRRCDGKLEKILAAADAPLGEFAPVSVEFGTVPSADSSFDNYYRLVKPAGFDPSQKYPLIIYVYGGPHSQMVTDSWLASVRKWELLMAQRGYVLYIQDNRGTDRRGAAFARAINRRCGQAETADQMAGLRSLIAEGWVDTSRIGVTGWSYGGFMTITMMLSHPEVFKAGAAGGPVIDWKWYEVMYGERYMDNPGTNPEGFALTSLPDKASKLKGRLLICQGMLDGTVLPINALSFVQACVDADLPIDFFPYPRSEHNVMGRNREQLYIKLTDFFEKNL